MSGILLDKALREQWCNGCKQPRRYWGPICGGMTQGDYTHYHSPEWWRSRLSVDGDTVGSPIPNTVQPEGSPAADPAAGTPSPEGVAVEAVAADPAVRDTDSETADRDRVEHERRMRLARWQKQP